MARGMGLVVAGTLLLTTIGCSFESLTLSENNGPHKEQIVTGSLTEVKTQVEKNLSQMQLMIKSSKDGDTYRITSKSPAGEKFMLVLKRVKGEKSEAERTSLRIEWEKNPDEMFWGVLVNAVANPASVGMPTMPQQYGMQGPQQYGMPVQQQYGMQGPQQYGMPVQQQYGMQGPQQYGMQGPQQFSGPSQQYGVPGPQYGMQGPQQFGGPGQQ